MRKVKVGAIQPAYIGMSEVYNCYSDQYRNEPDEIMENYVRQQVKVTVDLLRKAGEQGCDIVTTSESIAGLNSYCMDVSDKNIFPQLVELSRKLVEAELSDIAKQYSMYVIGCYNKCTDGSIYNLATIFDRQGNAIGEYRKTHLPSDEKWQCAEGENIDVFDLDFGRIGICICYDIMFPEVVGVQALKGAEIIFHPTLGYGWYESIGEATIRTRANDNSLYIITAKNYQEKGAGRSSVTDHWGHILVDAGYEKNAIVTCEIDLDIKKEQPDWYFPSHTSGTTDVKSRHLMERRPELYTAVSEPLADKLKMPEGLEKLEVLKRIKSGHCRW